jgi:hypothetical protein
LLAELALEVIGSPAARSLEREIRSDHRTSRRQRRIVIPRLGAPGRQHRNQQVHSAQRRHRRAVQDRQQKEAESPEMPNELRERDPPLAPRPALGHNLRNGDETDAGTSVALP